MSYWREIIIVLLVLWAIYHTVAEAQQDKRIDQLAKDIKKLLKQA